MGASSRNAQNAATHARMGGKAPSCKSARNSSETVPPQEMVVEEDILASKQSLFSD